jgi:transposase
MNEVERRTLGMQLLSKGISQAEVARRCEVSRQTANNWAQRVSEGLTAEPVKPGPKSKIDERTFAQFEKKVAQQLKRGEHVTLETAGKLLKREFGYKLSRAQLARLMSQSNAATPRQQQFKRNDSIDILRTWADASWQF